MRIFRGTERTIFFGALLALLLFSYFLYDDSLLFPNSDTNALELIGSVSVSQNDVRRKNLDTFSWLPANNRDTIYQNDSIFTGDRSDATIQLQDGTLINIRPNSLITLNLKNGQMNLDLKYGDLTGELAEGASVKIKSGQEEFEIKSTPGKKEKSRIKFNKAHSGIVDLKLLAGDAKYVDIKKNAIQDLPKDSLVAVNKNGDLKSVIPPQLTLKTPDNSSWVRVNPDDPLPFDWVGTGDVARYQLEISPSADFSTIAVAKETTGQSLTVSDPFPPGAYFWRIKALDAGGNVAAMSAAMAMSVAHLSAPEITKPLNATQINLELKTKAKAPLSSATEIHWKAMSQLKTFTWQLAEDPEFKALLKEGQTAELSALTPPLGNGTYWVRVQGQTESKSNSPWSAPVSFTLNLMERKEARPKAPILLTKKVQFKIPDKKERTPASPQAPVLAWKPVLQTKAYQLQISRDASFTEVSKYDISNTQVSWSEFKPGVSFYRVYAKGFNGLLSEASEVGSIEVSVGDLILNPLKSIKTISDKASPKETAVSWNEVPFAKSYLVQLDTTRDFKQPQLLEYTTTSGRLILSQPGKYAVRVQALDENSKPLTDFSNIEEVLYSHRSPLTAPSLLEPFNNASIFLQMEMEPFIWLEWKKVANAVTYRVEVSNKPDFSKVLIAKSVTNNRFLIKEKLPLGRIYWRVRAESKSEAETSDWAELREFTLYHQKNETFIK